MISQAVWLLMISPRVFFPSLGMAVALSIIAIALDLDRFNHIPRALQGQQALPGSHTLVWKMDKSSAPTPSSPHPVQ